MNTIETLSTLYGYRLNIIALRLACTTKMEEVARQGVLAILNGAIIHTHDLIAGNISEADYVFELKESQCPFEEEFIESVVENREYKATPEDFAIFSKIVANINANTALHIEPYFENI